MESSCPAGQCKPRFSAWCSTCPRVMLRGLAVGKLQISLQVHPLGWHEHWHRAQLDRDVRMKEKSASERI